MKTNQEQQCIIQPNHHHLPVRKPLSMVQYWVDTGSLPHEEICHNNYSSSGSSLSEDELPQSIGISSVHLVVNSIKQISENGKSDIKTSTEILSKLTSNLTSSSVDTVAYILANNNKTKKADTKAILKGSKICNEPAHNALQSNGFDFDKHNANNDLDNECTTTLYNSDKTASKAETEKCQGYVIAGEQITEQKSLHNRCATLPTTSNSDESIFNTKLHLTPVNNTEQHGRKTLYKTTDSAVEFTPVSDIDELHYPKSRKLFEKCPHPALETPKVHLKSSFFHKRQKRQSKVKLYHQANANRSLDSICDKNDKSSDFTQNQKSQQWESKADYLTVCDEIRKNISMHSMANFNRQKCKATQPSLIRSVDPLMKKQNIHMDRIDDLESVVMDEKNSRVPCETKSNFQFTLVDSSEESESTPTKKENISNLSPEYKKSASFGSKQKNSLENKIVHEISPMSIKNSTKKSQGESCACESNNFNAEENTDKIQMPYTSSNDKDDSLNMKRNVHILNQTKINLKRNTQTLDNIESEISSEDNTNNILPNKLSTNIKKNNILKSKKNIKKNSSTDSTHTRLREIPINDSSSEEDFISSQPIFTKMCDLGKLHKNAKTHDELEQQKQPGNKTVKSRVVDGNKSDSKKAYEDSTITSSDLSDEEIPTSQIDKNSKIKNVFLPKILSFLGGSQESKMVKPTKKNSQRHSSNESSIHEKALNTIDEIESSQSCDTSFSSCSDHAKASVSQKKFDVKKFIKKKISPKHSVQLQLFTSSSTDEDNSLTQNANAQVLEVNVSNSVKMNAKIKFKTFTKETSTTTTNSYLTSRKKDAESNSDRLESSFKSFKSFIHKKRLSNKNDFSSSDEDIVALARKYKKIHKSSKKN